MSAHIETVSGFELPARLSGHPTLDFCNTRAGWRDGPPVEYLQTYEHLAVWAGFEELLEPSHVDRLAAAAAHSPRRADAILERARALRTSLYELLADPAAGREPHVLETELRAATAAVRLSTADTAFLWQIEATTGLEAPLAATAWSAGQLLTTVDLRHIHACPGTGCGWLFLDPRGRRRWCTMATCGNRAKARRFATNRRSS
jgi:predicted RNA-binding Zn ribbon-like protein